MSRYFTLLFLMLFSFAASGQITRRAVVRASGQSVISSKPDQAVISVGVTTQAQTAQEASDTNATQTTAVLNALRQLLGANAAIRTLGYSLSPVYRTTGGVTTIAGYSATNTVEVTLSDITLAGRVIDTAASAGATNVQGLRFTLKDPAPVRQQALREATMQARRSAESIASGLGLRVGTILVAEEGGITSVSPVVTGRAGVTAVTPIEAGSVDVSATVSVEAELIQ